MIEPVSAVLAEVAEVTEAVAEVSESVGEASETLSQEVLDTPLESLGQEGGNVLENGKWLEGKEVLKEPSKSLSQEVLDTPLESFGEESEKSLIQNGTEQYNPIEDVKNEVDYAKENTTVDDNGRPYMQDNKLVPNNQYELNGYQYETDDQGRIVHAEGKVTIPTEKQERWKDGKPELDERKDTDDRGHIMAHEFGGADTKGNLVPMDRELNQHGEYKKMENEVRSAVNEGKDVHVSVDIEYDGDSKRPKSFTVEVSVDGKSSEKTFLNK